MLGVRFCKEDLRVLLSFVKAFLATDIRVVVIVWMICKFFVSRRVVVFFTPNDR